MNSAEVRNGDVNDRHSYISRRGELVIVSNFLPGYQIGFKRSGSATYLAGIVSRFASRGWKVTWILLRPRIIVATIKVSDLQYRIVSPDMARLFGRYVVCSPIALFMTLAYKIFEALPPPARRRAQNARASMRRARGFVHVLGFFASASNRRFVQRYARAVRPCVVFFDSIFNFCSDVPTGSSWIVTHDVKAERASSLKARGFGLWPTDFTEETEKHILEAGQNLIAIQSEDAVRIRQMAPTSRVVVLPGAVEAPAGPSERTLPGRCVFVASGALPNLDGIRWFLDSCWQSIRASVPNAYLEIYGTICLQLADVPEGVRLMGADHELAAILRGAAVAIAPLHIGSGLKFKVVEAIVYGVPTVTTSVGAQGMNEIGPRPFVIADEPLEFAEAVTRLLTNEAEANSLAAAARAASPRFSADQVFEALETAIDQDVAKSQAAETVRGDGRTSVRLGT